MSCMRHSTEYCTLHMSFNTFLQSFHRTHRKLIHVDVRELTSQKHYARMRGISRGPGNHGQRSIRACRRCRSVTGIWNGMFPMSCVRHDAVPISSFRRWIRVDMFHAIWKPRAVCRLHRAVCRLHGGRAVCRLHAMQSADCARAVSMGVFFDKGYHSFSCL